MQGDQGSDEGEQGSVPIHLCQDTGQQPSTFLARHSVPDHKGPVQTTSREGIRPAFKGRTLTNFYFLCPLRSMRLCVMDPKEEKAEMIENTEVVLSF